MNSRERFVNACRRLTVDRRPVWLMRQAGRYLPEYQELREKYDFLTMCRRPDLIFEVSLQPWRRFGMDAVIVFSDILLPLNAMGMKLRFEENVGPRFDSKITTAADVKNLSSPNVRISLPHLLEATQNLRHELKEETALLGFVGAPWTLAAYMIEGGSGSFDSAISLLRESPEIVSALLEKITPTISSLAIQQVSAGSDAIQIFDTWGGLLSPFEYEKFALPYVKKIVSEIKKTGAVAILYVRNSSELFDMMISSGADVLSVGSDIDIKEAIGRAKNSAAIQGNLNPETLLRSPSTVERETLRMLEGAGNESGYIANLGHGVLPKTPVASVAAFVDTVKNAKYR